MVMLVSAVAALGLAVAGTATERGALTAPCRGAPDGPRLRGERMNPRRIASLVLIFSDVVLALAVWGVAIVVRAA
jgi:hypothetical protein